MISVKCVPQTNRGNYWAICHFIIRKAKRELTEVEGTKRTLLAVSGDFGREVLYSASAAALAQDVSVQRVAASTLPFRRQQESTFLMKQYNQFNGTKHGHGTSDKLFYNPVKSTHLTDITMDMEATVQSDYPHGLLLAWFGHDGLTAHRAARRILPVRGNNTAHLL